MVMRLVLLVAILLVPMSVGAQVKAPEPGNLAAAVFSAMQKGDFASYQKLMPTEEQLRALCPGARTQLQEHVAAAREWFEICREKGDWAKAKLGEVTGGEAKLKADSACPNAVVARNVKFEVHFPHDTTKVKLDNPLILNGQYLLIAAPVCR